VDREGWQKEIVLVKEHYAKFGGRLPRELTEELAALEKRLA
jgi:phosphoenolpyruvate carboxykinase (GTP)